MATALPKRSAREELAALTRERVMLGAARLIESGAEPTFRALAEACDVPERTLYRRFPSREALLAEFWTWLNQEHLQLPPPPRSLEELLRQIPALFAAFERREPLMRAMLRDPAAHSLRVAQSKARLAELGAALAGALRGAPPALRRKVLASARVLTSASGWLTYKDLGGLSSAEAAAAAQWALRALLAGIEGAAAR